VAPASDTENKSKVPHAEAPDAKQRLSLGAVLADKGYDSDDLLKYLASLEAEAVIPAKKNRKVGRPLNRELYKDRNKVERFFNRVKHYRRIATRYEKTALGLHGNAALSLDDGVAPVAVKRNPHSSARPKSSLLSAGRPEY